MCLVKELASDDIWTWTCSSSHQLVFEPRFFCVSSPHRFVASWLPNHYYRVLKYYCEVLHHKLAVLLKSQNFGPHSKIVRLLLWFWYCVPATLTATPWEQNPLLLPSIFSHDKVAQKWQRHYMHSMAPWPFSYRLLFILGSPPYSQWSQHLRTDVLYFCPLLTYY